MDDEEVSTWYQWPLHEFLEDGTLIIRTSVYGAGFHRSGKFSVAPGSPDPAFWMWLISVRKPTRRVGEKDHPVIHGSELEALREEYHDRPVGAA